MATYTEDFAGAVADLTAPWVQGRTPSSFGVVERDGSGHGRGQILNSDNVVVYNNTVGNDQYSQIAPQWNGTGTGADYVYLFVRLPSTAGWADSGATSYYMFWSDGGSDTAILWTSTGAAGTTVIDRSNGLTFASGDVLKLEVIGTTLKVYKNGVAITWTTSGTTSVTDAHVASGKPGFGVFNATTKTLLDNWEGGDVAGAAPFNGSAGPVPGGRLRPNVGSSDPLKLHLRSQDKQFGAAGQFQTYDWPNPRGKAFPSDLRTFTEAFTAELRGQDTQFAAPGEWKAYDYPNPRGPQYPSDLRTYTQTTDLSLLGKDTQFAGPGQWKSYEYPNPPGARRSLELLTWTSNGLTSRLPVGTQAPFSLTHWPNPAGPRTAFELRTFLNWYVIDDNAPFTPADLPNPNGPRVFRDSYGWRQNLLESVLAPVTASPFAQVQWPNPRGPQFAIEMRTVADASEFWLLSDTQFGAPGQGKSYDWPNPIGPRPFRDTYGWRQQGLLEGPLAPGVGNPFAQTEWPNPPRGAVFASLLRTFAGNPLTIGQVGGEKPFLFKEWPNPRGPKYPPSLIAYFSRNPLIDPVILALQPDIFRGTVYLQLLQAADAAIAQASSGTVYVQQTLSTDVEQ